MWYIFRLGKGVQYHKILLNKYGVRGIALNLFKALLLNRKQYTVVNSKKSNSKSIKCGIPQGSTLGPLLFIIYMNDMPNASKFKTTLDLLITRV